MKQKLKINDKVGYSSRWLKSCGIYTGNLPRAKGIITGIQFLGKELQIATVSWDLPDVPTKINVKNLARIGTANWANV